MNKEYGGYLPIELPKGSAYYTGNDVVALNAGRYAIAYAVQEAGWDCIHLPYYICDTVETAIRESLPDIRIQRYHVDKNLLPDSVTLLPNEGLLWVNYFGIQPDHVIDEMVERFHGQLLIDNTQSFFTRPRKEAWQVYSCRKFFGVCDGSYVIHENIHRRALPQQFSSLHAAHLLHSLEYGTNYSYALNKENEERLCHCGMGAMSPLTTTILGAVDYSDVNRRRTENMEALHQILGPHNLLPISRPMPAMSYPFLYSGEGLREKLVQNKIYVPKLWEETSCNKDASPWEVFLSEHLCTLPVDQRYSIEDMNTIGNFVSTLIDENN